MHYLEKNKESKKNPMTKQENKCLDQMQNVLSLSFPERSKGHKLCKYKIFSQHKVFRPLDVLKLKLGIIARRRQSV